MVTPLLTGVLTRGALVGLSLLVLGSTDPAQALTDLGARDPFGVGAWPLYLQAPLALVLADALSYWSHRARHHWAPLTCLHEVHHAPDGLSWSAAARMHPLDDLLDNGFVFFPLLCLGFSPALVLLLGPVLLLHTIYLHANVRLSLGPLDHLLATPAFHRAHHGVGGSGNYGGIFTIWDRLFGTLIPPGPTPITGLGRPMPETLLAQLVLPVARIIPRR